MTTDTVDSDSSLTGGASPVVISRANGVATITLNRPRRKNAITASGWALLRDALAAIDPTTDRAVVITGAGDAFCSGADLADTADDQHQLDYMRVVNQACVAVHRLPVPTVARVDGPAVGAGLGLALACDFVLASDRSRFSAIFVRRGLSADFGTTWILPKLVGLHVAKELVLLGDMFDAEEAKRIGVVRRVVPADALDAEVADIAGRLRDGPPIPMRLSKEMLNDSFNIALEGALQDEARAQTVSLGLEDTEEAYQAFVEKREPVFKGR